MITDPLSARSEGDSEDADSPDESLPTRFERLFRLQNPALLRMLNGRLHDPEAAKEVAQEAYEEIFKRDRAGTLTNLRAATLAYLRNYLFKTARNIATDRLRTRSRRIRDSHLVAFHAGGCDAPSAEFLCIHEQEWECLQRAILELPPKCKQAFLLVEFESLSVAQVAQQMGIKPNSVYQLCKRAYEHLMQALADEDLRRGERG